MSNETTKHDQGKPRLSLLPPTYWRSMRSQNKLTPFTMVNIASIQFQSLSDARQVIENTISTLSDFIGPLAVVQVLEYGADKYGRNNWRAGTAWSRYLDAALRHMYELTACEYDKLDTVLDTESGLPQIAHVIANLSFLLEYMTHGLGVNDVIVAG